MLASNQPNATRLVLLYLLTVLSLPIHAAELNYETIRFHTKKSKPERLYEYAVSPDGRYLALSFDPDVDWARRGVTLVDLNAMSIMGTYGETKVDDLAFASDSKTVLAIGSRTLKREMRRFDVRTGNSEVVPTARRKVGVLGIKLQQKNGKLLITNILRNINPTIDDSVRVGDEIMSINFGQKPIHYDDKREWKSLTGKSPEEVSKLMLGPPGTWLQLRVIRRGSPDEIETSLQRQWPNGIHPKLPSNGECILFGSYNGNKSLRSADTGKSCGYVSLRDAQRSGMDLSLIHI